MTTQRSTGKSELSVRDVEGAVAAIAAGRIVVVIDDVDRENEGDLIMAAQYATESQVAFFVRHTSGVLCVPLDDGRCDELGLPLMVPPELNADPQGTAFTVSVDARAGTTTGISAADRATTIRVLAGVSTMAGDLRRPGHVFPLRARHGGVLTRPGHTEAAVDLCRLAGLAPVGLLAEIVSDDGSMARRPKLLAFARRHDLPVVTIADLVAYRLHKENPLRRLATSRIPLRGMDFSATVYGSAVDSTQHVALSLGAPHSQRAPLVRVHSECLTGDVFGSERCDCGDQLARSIELIADAGVGVLVYLRGHEGRGIGLPSKLRAYELQDYGLDTVDANLAQGLPVDARNYTAAGHILHDLGLDAVRLLTNNPAKTLALRAQGIHVVEEVPLPGTVTPVNVHYLRTKKHRLGHQLDLEPPGSPSALGIS